MSEAGADGSIGPSDDKPLSELPADSTSKVSNSEAKKILRGPIDKRPVSSVDDAVKESLPEGADAGTRMLHALLRRSPFFDYFVRVADRRYAGKNREPKVRQLIEDSRRFYRVVLLADLLLLGGACALILWAAAGIIFSTLWN